MMIKLKIIHSPYWLAFVCSLVVGCSIEGNKAATPALYETRSEAEKAAKAFNCSGAHKMGEMWMPCNKHFFCG